MKLNLTIEAEDNAHVQALVDHLQHVMELHVIDWSILTNTEKMYKDDSYYKSICKTLKTNKSKIMKLIKRVEEYKNVYRFKSKVTDKDFKYFGQVGINKVEKKSKHYKSMRDAAKWVDLELIINNKEPRNILKRKL